jgi:YVTN family beta-propeller protein
VIDTTSNKVIATIPVGNDPSQIAVSPNGRRVYVSNNSNQSVSVIDTGLEGVIATVPVGSIPEGLAIDPSGARLYVANSGPNSVSVVDTATNAVTKTIDVGTTPFGLAVRPDGARLFVANRQDGNVSVIDTGTNAVAKTIDVGFSPKGMGQFIVPSLHTPVFGAAARKCQAAVSRQGIKLAKLHHGLEATCQLGRIKAEAAGSGTAKAEAACLKLRDPGDPASKLFRARLKLRGAVARSCSKVLPGDLNAPCARGAAGFGDTADCLIAQHGARVEAMAADEFSATRPVPLGAAAQICETAIAKNGRRFADKLHKDLGGCLEKLLLAAETGKNEPKAIATCLGKLDLGSPISKASIARSAALLAIAQRCAGVAPAALGSPCDSAASDLPAVASCVLSKHVDDVGKLIAAEFNDVCVILARIGLASAYLAVCSGH